MTGRSWRPRASRHIDTALGPMVVALGVDGLAGLWFVDQRHYPAMVGWPGDAADPLFDAVAGQLDEYLRGERRRFELPLDLSRGTAFQQTVWRALLGIPHGASSTYGRIATAIGRPAAARAVGAAVGRNPIGIIVPCHRVFGADDSPTGYAGGIERKLALRRLETAGGAIDGFLNAP
ncbi:MAG: methylated-DNA--[protein]-cysteine S-methyltransferase [Pseudomonadota bacterium]|jgi:methylated-DNA-[protein]-cysteine S-methyltransferase|nr:methylated-DNA--[protein]-cysteine S-methyltransferase [Pseudomonadota bacterium]